MSVSDCMSSTDESIGVNSFEIRCPYQCNIGNCKITFKRKDALDRHIYSHTGKKTYKCTKDDCTKLYICQTHLRRHLKEFHEKKPRTLCKIKCKDPACLFDFNTENQMQNHYIKTHSSIKKYKCDFCEAGYNHKMQFKRHMITHNEKYPHKCEQCDRGFFTLRKKESHMKQHQQIKCSDCDKEFELWASYVAHRKCEHRKEYSCETCNRKFNNKLNLKDHTKIHTSLAERDVFPCPHEKCSKFYLSEKNLKFHIKSKHEAQMHKCTYENCNAQLVTKQKLQQHLQLHERKCNTMKKRKKILAKRKDFGSKKISTASKLAGVINPNNIERLIINGNSDAVNVLQTIVEPYESSAATDTDTDLNDINKKEHLTELSFIDIIESNKINYRKSIEDSCIHSEEIKTI